MNTRIRTTALAAAAVLVTALPAWAQDAADRIWSGGPIITMNDKAMRAEAVAERAARSSPSGRRPA